ncbi:MAG: hypothetical protein WCZ13_01820 [Acholeplasmataceae bacterium]|nr:hypothetical protein [Acholeplasmataceae bacterium]
MQEFIYFLIFLAIAFILLWLFLQSIKKKNMEKLEIELRQFGEVTRQKDIYDFTLQIENSIYKIKVIYASNLKEVSFNSKKHWQVSNSSGSKMLDTKGFETLSGNKIILIYPTPERVLRYINENEVVFVKPSMDIWGMNVLCLNDLEAYFTQVKE